MAAFAGPGAKTRVLAKAIKAAEVASRSPETPLTDQNITAVDQGSATTEHATIYVGATNSATTNSALLWQYWIKSQHTWTNTTTSEYVDTDVWGEWNNQTDCLVDGQRVKVWHAWAKNEYVHSPPVRRQAPSPEEVQRTQEEQRARAEKLEAERKLRVAQVEMAVGKSEKLLMSSLNDNQKMELKTKGYFSCKSQKGILYRIYKGTHGNVKRLDPTGTKEIESLCIQPANVPDFDAMLAQKLHIEYNEDDFRKTANIRPVYN